MLAVLETHPVQYHAPVYRRLVAAHHVPVTAIYGSDYSVRGSVDHEFGRTVRWDVDLVSGYGVRFVRPGSNAPVSATIRELRQELRAVRPNAVLLTGYTGPFHRSAIAAATSLGLPLVLRAETTDHAIARSPARALVRDLALRALYRRLDAVCPIGSRSRAHYERLGVETARMFDAPYDVDTTPFRTDEGARAELRLPTRAELGIDTDAPVVLYSGKLSERKGVDDLIEAARSLGSETHLVFVGDGERRTKLEHALSTSMPGRAHFLGFRNQRELSPLFHASDVLVLPSRRSETWGLVVNEALHHGLPVVVTEAVGCAPDLVVEGETGFVVPTRSPDALARSILRALAMRGAEVRDRCRASVARVSLDRAAEGIAAAYRAVTQHPSHAG